MTSVFVCLLVGFNNLLFRDSTDVAMADSGIKRIFCKLSFVSYLFTQLRKKQIVLVSRVKCAQTCLISVLAAFTLHWRPVRFS